MVLFSVTWIMGSSGNGIVGLHEVGKDGMTDKRRNKKRQ
jgi:hypothetical protein